MNAPTVERMKAEADPRRVKVAFTSAGCNGNVNSAPYERLSGSKPLAKKPRISHQPKNIASFVGKY